MKMTLLQMTQSIMSDLDTDEVTSITDTVESAQIASIIEDIYWQLITDQTIPELNELNELDTIVLGSHPGAISYLQIPVDVSKVLWFQYNIQQLGDTTDAYSYMTFIPPTTFIDMVSGTDKSASTSVQVTDPKSGLQYWIPNDKAPTYWTTFDDQYIALDAIDKTIDTVQLLGTKSRCQMTLIPTFTQSDGFIPTCDDNIFPLLLAESKSTAFMNLKQTINQKIEGQSRGQRLRLQNHKYRTGAAQKKSFDSPNYGRRAGSAYYGLKAPNF